MDNRRKESERNPANDDPMKVLNACKVTSKEAQEWCNKTLKDQKLTLSLEDVEQLLVALENDGKIQSSLAGCSKGDGSVTLWRAVPNWMSPPTMLRTMCGVCPVSF